MAGSQENDAKEPDIVVTGVGGAGNNTIHRLSSLDIKNLRPIAVNTDKLHIEIIDCPTKVLIGEDLTHGLGTAGCPKIGEECARRAHSVLSKVIGSPDILFVVAGMGGGTGTGASVVIAKVGRDKGAFVVSVVSMPFSVEGKRTQVAEEGLEKLRRHADCVVVIENDRLIEIGGHLPIEEAFSIVDHLISGLIENISQNITLPSKITEEPEDIMSKGLAPSISLESLPEIEEEQGGDHTDASIDPPPLVTVDIGGMADIVKSEDPRSLQGMKMAEHVVNTMKMPDIPKKSNVLISETRPLTLLPFMVPDTGDLEDDEYLRELMKKGELLAEKNRLKLKRGGKIVKKIKENDDKEEKVTKTTMPMTQTKLDNVWI